MRYFDGVPMTDPLAAPRRVSVRVLLAATILTALLVGADVAQAGDRVLLVGIGRYGAESPVPDLPGVEIDLAKMREVVDVLGFAPEQVRVLTDEQATEAGILAAIQTWLVDGTTTGGRALFYFSGHGSQVQDRGALDERDGLDEVLVAHDARLMTVEGTVRATGVVLDDALAALFSQLEDRELVAIIDACSSGTATRSGFGAELRAGATWAVKSVALEKIAPRNAVNGSSDAGGYERDVEQSWISLAAARDAEDAIATPYGSLFTQALHSRVVLKRGSGETLSFEALRDYAQDYVAKRFAELPASPTPVLIGPRGMLSKGIRITQPTALGPVRQQLERLSRPEHTALIRVERHRYPIGADIQVPISIPTAGYLNVIAVNARDEAEVLFPNALRPDNRFAGPTQLILGDPSLGFRLEAVEPQGESYLLAIFTDANRPLNFYYEALAEFGDDYGVQRGIAKLSTAAVLQTKGIRITSPRSAYIAHGVVLDVGQ